MQHEWTGGVQKRGDVVGGHSQSVRCDSGEDRGGTDRFALE